MKKSSKKKSKTISKVRASVIKFDPKRSVQYGFAAVAVGIIGFALYLTARFGVSKTIIDALLQYKLLLLGALIVPLAWKLYEHKLEGFIDWLITFVLYVSGLIIAIYFLFPLLPEGYWAIMLVAPIVIGLVVSQFNSSNLLIFCFAIGIIASFGAIYLATFDFYIAAISTLPTATSVIFVTPVKPLSRLFS